VTLLAVVCSQPTHLHQHTRDFQDRESNSGFINRPRVASVVSLLPCSERAADRSAMKCRLGFLDTVVRSTAPAINSAYCYPSNSCSHCLRFLTPAVGVVIGLWWLSGAPTTQNNGIYYTFLVSTSISCALVQNTKAARCPLTFEYFCLYMIIGQTWSTRQRTSACV